MGFTRELTNDNHVHRLVIIADAHGWDVREEEDSAVVRLVHRTDWHRVERDVWLFDVKALRLNTGTLVAT